jgi:drug/metabolite transporter (DMT)-like permease
MVRTLPGRSWMLATAAAAAASIFLGASVTATRFAVAEIEPLPLAFIRYGIAAACLLPFVLASRLGRLSRRDLLRIGLLGIVMFGLFPWFFTAGLQYIPASRAALWLAMTPFLTFALLMAMGSESATPMKLGGIALATVGALFALAPQAGAATGANAWMGDLLLVATACCGAVYLVLSRGVLARHPALLVTCLAMAAGSAFLGVVYLVFGNPRWPTLSPAAWATVAFLGTFGGAIAFALWLWAIKRTTPTRTAVYLTLNPVAATLTAVLLLGEQLTLAFVTGLAMVLAGIVVANLRPAQPRAIATGAP